MTYRVTELESIYRKTTLARGLPRRSAGEAWLIDYCREHGLIVICRDTDDANDAIDVMTDAWRQFAVERELDP